jgi:hypothetical protein
MKAFVLLVLGLGQICFADDVFDSAKTFHDLFLRSKTQSVFDARGGVSNT